MCWPVEGNIAIGKPPDHFHNHTEMVLKSNWCWKKYRCTESNLCLSEMGNLGKEGHSNAYVSLCTSQFHTLLPLSVWTDGSCKSRDLTENGQNLTCCYSDILMLVVFDVLCCFLMEGFIGGKKARFVFTFLATDSKRDANKIRSLKKFHNVLVNLIEIGIPHLFLICVFDMVFIFLRIHFRF